MKIFNVLIKNKKKKVNKKLYLIQLEYLNFDNINKKKKRNSILKIDEKCKKYIDDNSKFSESDYNLFENKLKNTISYCFSR